VPGGVVTEEITVVQLKTGHTTLTTSKGTKNKFDEVTAEWDKTKELYVEQLNAVHTALVSHKYFKNNNTGLKKISAGILKKDETETAKTDELSDKEGFEESHVLKQKADDAALDPSTFIAILYEPAGHNEVAAELTETETERISTRLQSRDKAEKVDVNS
jgi:hypothetical protein